MFTGFSVVIRHNTVITLVKKNTFSLTRGATLAEVFFFSGQTRSVSGNQLSFAGTIFGLVIVININVISLVGARLGSWLRR